MSKQHWLILQDSRGHRGLFLASSLDNNANAPFVSEAHRARGWYIPELLMWKSKVIYDINRCCFVKNHFGPVTNSPDLERTLLDQYNAGELPVLDREVFQYRLVSVTSPQGFDIQSAPPSRKDEKPKQTRPGPPRWNRRTGSYLPDSGVDAFLNDIDAVCKKHGKSISHEDSQGSFVVVAYSKLIAQWMFAAGVDLPPPKAPRDTSQGTGS